MDKVVFSTIIHDVPIIVTIDDERLDAPNNLDFFYVRVGETWSMNKGSDMTIVVKALITQNFEVLAYGSEHLIALRNDLLKYNVISFYTHELITQKRAELRANKCSLFQ